MGRRRFDPRRQQFSGPRTNERIRVPEVRVIGSDGEMLGIMDTRDAKQLAREKSLDLVEVNPKASPPVCKVMDYGKYKYEESKKKRQARKAQVQVELKEVKLRPKTDDHDLEFKVKHARRFLEEGNKVKITCRFRGREITHPETARRQLDYVMEQCQDIGQMEQTPRMEGRTMTCIISPKQEIRAKVAAQAAHQAKKAARREQDEKSDKASKSSKEQSESGAESSEAQS
ncbi:MAG TPA: translation initiation factor IF-3 [Sandaracinaceae bacterium LLY-WYZ-13_1]|nr:translation initiation factor IF-3 [Sandaracinaceae bacterium LLY-WYZ-13_1]